MGYNDKMRMHGLKAIVLAAGLALAGGMAQAQTAPAAAPSVPAAEAPKAPAPVAVESPAAAAAPAAATTETAAPAAATPADPTLNPDGTHKNGPTPGIGQPVDKHIGIQPQVTKLGESAAHFHNWILLPIITIISVFVLILLGWTILRYRRKANPNPSKTSHNTLIEIIWTVVPVLILAVIAWPSISLLAKQFKPAPDNAVTIKAIGNQWYWSYEYPDHGAISITANMLKEKGDPTLAKGARYRTDVDGPRLLAADNRIVVPVGTPIRLIATANDVIHSWAIPAFWIKIDAVPGRLNETSFIVDKPGVYFGQCSELCGARHAYMPIVVEAVEPAVFAQWVAAKGGKMPEAAKPAAAAPAAVAPAAAPAGNTAETPADNAAEAAATTNQADQ
ncbi:cytochrome c oxidase subunit II [Sphingomonas koreensis]|jgi:cytochrome c oxidase subunit 2|uniref:Cytochrome c oxidase subunit 2 n=2 Tax=Sphingomonas koreensis TaxID=93064 RepID=A0A1L6J6C8_9SPHN|nr:cytochrome c oxidase subunit II [Sphingomonas koreensis]APR51503.1 cytochrome c oxidase subunit II [Sphingomonas koreensis]MDC7812865.1 cytochrome c oxidase subunit II [Sphingomonas koreensis]